MKLIYNTNINNNNVNINRGGQKMIKTWYNTDVQTAASMLDVSDEKIRSWSNGRVTGTYYDA